MFHMLIVQKTVNVLILCIIANLTYFEYIPVSQAEKWTQEIKKCGRDNLYTMKVNILQFASLNWTMN
jgi:hypothetical protein